MKAPVIQFELLHEQSGKLPGDNKSMLVTKKEIIEILINLLL